MFSFFARSGRALLFCLSVALFASACGSTADELTTANAAVSDATDDAMADDAMADDTADDAMADDTADDAMADDTADDAMADDTADDAMADDAMADDTADDAMADDTADDAMADDAMADGDHDMADGGHEHGHGGQEVSSELPTPSITVEAFADPAGGWTVHAVPVNHRIAPENASTDHIDGEGHMHLYVDGERIGRIYNEWVPIPALGAGTHEIRVELSANNHSALTLNGDTIEAIVTVEEAEASAGHHGHGDDHVVEAADGQNPSVTIEAFEDPKAGWNVRAVASNHTLAPQSVSTDPVDGEGHMHLYVDGDKVGRMYGEWVHIGTLTDGDHELRVELSANNHKPLAVDGEIVEAVTTITQVDGISPIAMDDDHGSTADNQFLITLADGEVSGDTGRLKIELGTTVEIVVDGDVTEEVHVHGYDYLGDMTSDKNAVIEFTADIPGIFEVELEGSGMLLAELEVR